MLFPSSHQLQTLLEVMSCAVDMLDTMKLQGFARLVLSIALNSQIAVNLCSSNQYLLCNARQAPLFVGMEQNMSVCVRQDQTISTSVNVMTDHKK